MYKSHFLESCMELAVFFPPQSAVLWVTPDFLNLLCGWSVWSMIHWATTEKNEWGMQMIECYPFRLLQVLKKQKEPQVSSVLLNLFTVKAVGGLLGKAVRWIIFNAASAFCDLFPSSDVTDFVNWCQWGEKRKDKNSDQKGKTEKRW